METRYEERYCAYVDILGFKELVANIRRGSADPQTVRQLLTIVHKPRDSEVLGLGETDFHAQNISDALVLSTRLTVEGLSVLIDTLEDPAINALVEGYFIRGALCRGLLYHDRNTAFGDALIHAYQLESQIVRYPRVMVTSAVVTDAMNSNLRQYFVDHIKPADDGPYFIHCLSKVRMILDVLSTWSPNSGIPKPNLSRCRTIYTQIQKRLDEAVDNPRHFEKAQWFARYWNDSIIVVDKDVVPIHGPGIDIRRSPWSL
jgi:hypothetical protein